MAKLTSNLIWQAPKMIVLSCHPTGRIIRFWQFGEVLLRERQL